MIKVEFTPRAVLSAGNELHQVTMGEEYLKALRLAEIPVIGTAFVVMGVERGVITMWTEGRTRFVNWREDDKDNSRDGFQLVHSKNGVLIYKNGKHWDDEL